MSSVPADDPRTAAVGRRAKIAAPAAAKAAVAKPTFITWTALAMMTTGSVASLRSAPTMAVFGLASVFLYVVPAIVFLVIEGRAIAALLIVLAAVSIPVYKEGKDNRKAQRRADRVAAAFAAHGLTVPVDRKTLIAVLGPDGGSVCDSPSGALTKAMQDVQPANGAATVGARPTRVDHRVIEGEALVLSVYCPAKLPAFRKYADAKRYYHVIRG